VKNLKIEGQLIAGHHHSRMVHRSSSCAPSGQREILWSEDVPVTKKKACRPKAISRCRAFCSFLECLSEQFANLVDGDD